MKSARSERVLESARFLIIFYTHVFVPCKRESGYKVDFLSLIRKDNSRQFYAAFKKVGLVIYFLINSAATVLLINNPILVAGLKDLFNAKYHNIKWTVLTINITK